MGKMVDRGNSFIGFPPHHFTGLRLDNAQSGSVITGFPSTGVVYLRSGVSVSQNLIRMVRWEKTY